MSEVETCVYIFEGRHANVYKIGVSHRPEIRLGEVGGTTILYAAMFPAFYIACGNEAALHRRYASQCVRFGGYELSTGREWFMLSYYDLLDCVDYLARRSEYTCIDKMGLCKPTPFMRSFATSVVDRMLGA